MPPNEDPTAPLALPKFEPHAPPVGAPAVRAAASTREASAVSEVVGPTVIPQIVVGSPSPRVEPVAIAADYRSLPFRPDVVIDGWSTDAITLRGASLRGHLHRYNGAPRQDDFALHHLADGRVIALVADGVSGAPQSHIGASTATRQAAEWLHANLDENLAATDWVGLLKSTAWALNERAQSLLGLAEPDPVRAEEQLATTLMCAVIEPVGPGALRAYLVGAGDSAAWLLSSGRFTQILGGKSEPESGITSSAVVGLPRVAPEVTAVQVDIKGDEVLLIATDGIGDPLGAGQGGVGNLFRDVLTRPCPPSLIEFAHAVDFSRETFDDDRTLVAVWPKKQVSPVPAAPPRRPGFLTGEGGLPWHGS
ncbi:protein phosphatase 2C domain-containing protein [Mycobacterium interjectum]|uniref:protein phosphatase 2C domain-containing protein n=1 Tax=Mycobacterium interjectum TaxID=33895 RepID=UPI00082C5FEC|nr:protein phosphatase 2C domain-containing protein [Mycobacterium interjectum]MCV7088769.1 protein phosphatase 2C domain-containing protein [Mycobacterium interjectum]